MALTRIVKGMLASESVTPDNLVNTSTYTVGGLVSNGNVSATGNATVGGNVSIASTITLTAGIGLKVEGITLSSSTNLLYYDPTTKAVTYAGPGAAGNPFNQTLNTNSNVTFASLTIGGQTLGPSGSVLTLGGLTATTITVNRTLVANTASFNFLNVGQTSTWFTALGYPGLTIKATDTPGNVGHFTTNLDFRGRWDNASAGSAPGGRIIGDIREVRSDYGWGLKLASRDAFSDGSFTNRSAILVGGSSSYGVATNFITFQGTSTFFDVRSLLPYPVGPGSAVRSVDIGSTSSRFNVVYANSLNVLNNTIYFEDEAGTTTSTLSLTSGVVSVDGTALVNQSVTTGSTPTFAGINVSTVGFTDLTATNATITNLTVLGTMTTLNVTTENVTTENIVTQNFADGTSQTTAWTGTVANSQITSVSTSKVTGLSVVGWTNNYNDLINKPTISGAFDLSTVTNQGLFTTSSVTFGNITDSGTLSVTGFTSLNGGATISAATVTNALTVGTNLTAGMTSVGGLSVTTGTQITKSLSVGGYPLNSAGTGSYFLSTGVSPAVFVSNYTTGVQPTVVVRGYGGAAAPNPAIRLDSAYGTGASPTAIPVNQNLGGLIVSGYDGANWPSDNGQAYNFLGWFATEAMTNSGTSTYQAGSGFNIYTQPQWTRTGVNATRQRFLFTNWTTSTTGPSVNNINIGSGVDGTFPTMTMVDGTTYTGYGRANLNFVNATPTFLGVPAQDAAPDNVTVTATNIMTFASGRRSGVSGRRNAIVSGDTLGQFNFNGQTAANATGVGLTGAQMIVSATENFGAGARGSQIAFNTVNTATTTISTRLNLSDRINSYRADSHSFGDKTGSFTALTLSTSTAAFGSGVAITTYNRTYGDFLNTATTTFTINTGTAIAFTPGTVQANCSVQSGSQLLISQSGTYNLQFSIQIANGDNAERNFWVWLRKNGADVAQSATKYTIVRSGAQVAMLTFNVTSNGSDYFQIMGAVDNVLVTLPSYAANSQGFPSPAIPAVIVCLVPVGA
jgi:hypothetical protein